MDDETIAELEIVLMALAANIDAYGQAALQVKRYRWYALCRRQETERRRLHDLLAGHLPIMPAPVPLRSKLWLRAHRVVTWFRLLGRSDKSLLRDLRREDILLLKLIAAFVEDNPLDTESRDAFEALVRTVILADNEIAHIVQRRASGLLGADRRDQATQRRRPSPMDRHGYA